MQKNLILLSLIIAFTGSCSKSSSEKNRNQDPVNVNINSKDNTKSSAPEGMGFYLETDASISEAVKQASQSVFRLAVPAGSRIPVTTMFNGKTTQQALDLVESLDESKLSKPDKIVFSFQLRECLKKPDSECLIFEGIEQGTGFTVGDGSKIATASHVIKSISSNSDQLPIFIFDANNTTVYTPNDLSLKISSSGSVQMTEQKNADIQKKLDDVVILQASKKIAEPLRPAAKKLQPGEKTFIVGFPMPTTDRQKFGALDSDGKSRYVSQGHLLNAEEIKNIATKKYGGVEDSLLQAMTTYLIISSADGAPGVSGGPTLNENGEYLGVFTSAAPQYDAAIDHLSYSTPINVDFEP